VSLRQSLDMDLGQVPNKIITTRSITFLSFSISFYIGIRGYTAHFSLGATTQL